MTRRPWWLVTGATGMLGQAVLHELARRDVDGVGLGRADLDVTDRDSVFAAVAGGAVRPDVVVNCAAWTAVDAAESEEPRASEVNGVAPGHIAAACALAGSRFVHVSTDYVFDGRSPVPYGEDDPTAPLNAYGRGKLAGERTAQKAWPDGTAIVRTAWLYGPGGRNFVRTMTELAAGDGPVEVVADQVGQPTAAHDLAGWIVTLGRHPSASGIFHGTNGGRASWWELAREVFDVVGADPARVRRGSSAAWSGAARRPRRTVLDHAGWDRIGMARPREWRQALREHLGDR